jgi:hypothetical protein
MAISQAMCTSFKQAIMDGDFDFAAGTTQVFKIALYTSAATLGASTTAYTATNEVANGSGYTTGGATLTLVNTTTSGTTAFIDFADVTWSTASFTARGALIYMDNGGTNPSIAVLDFGSDKTSSGGNFVVQFPAADATNAVVRIA